MSAHKRIVSVLILFCLSVLVVQTDLLASNRKPEVYGNARFTVITPVCIRLEYSDNQKFVNKPSLFAVGRDIVCSDYTTVRTDTNLVIKTDCMRLVYEPDGRFFHHGNLSVGIQKNGGEVLWRPGMENKGNLGGTLRTLDQVNGKTPLPDGLLSRDGWALVDDSRRPLLTSDWVMQRPEDAGLDWYLFGYGTDYKAALKALTTISGPVPLPRKYVLGSWYSRYWPYSSDDYRKLVQEYEEHDFPLDIMVLDMDWHRDGWTGWSWNRDLLPDAEDLLKWLHEQNLFVTLNVHPADGVGPHEDMYKAFMADMGIDLSKISREEWPTLPYDASNKRYLDTLFKHTHADKEAAGVDFWWLDWQQYTYTLGNPELKNLEWLNQYYFNYAARGKRRGISFSRWGGWGDHQHPIHFSGDAHANWPTLAFEVPFTSTAGNVGCFFWSHDIGGHMGGMEAETNTRWVQFGALTAALRLHSTRDAGMDKRPWLADKPYTDAMRRAFHLRSRLFPYIYTSVRQSCENSIPLTRPMYIEYPKTEAAYQHPQQYFFGDAFLVAPVVQPGVGPEKLASQRVWFPDGIWYNWFSGERIEGIGQIDLVWSDLNTFPLYVRGGVPVAMQPYTARMTTAPLDTLIIRIFSGRNGQRGQSVLYEDDGISKAYRSGAYAVTEFTYERACDAHTVTIHPAKGSFHNQAETRTFVIELAGTQAADSVLVNGLLTRAEYDSVTGLNRIIVPDRSIRKPLKFVFKTACIDVEVSKKGCGRLWEAICPDRNADRSPGVILKSVDDLQADTPKEKACMSLACGIGLFVEDRQTLHVVRDVESQVLSPVHIDIIDTYGREEKTVYSEVFDLKAGTQKTIQVASPVTEMLGIQTVRAARLSVPVEDKMWTWSEVIDKKESFIQNWIVTGPFPYDPETDIASVHYAPEKDWDTEQAYVSELKEVRWRKVSVNASDMVDLFDLYGTENSLAYAQTRLMSDRKQAVRFHVNSDDGVEMWLNGEKIHSRHIFRAASAERDKVEAMLKKGDNILLLKVSQGTGGWEFRVAVDLEHPVHNTFPDN